jgi:hypothetical protein
MSKPEFFPSGGPFGEIPSETPAQREARAQLDWLAEHHLDLHPGRLATVVRKAPGVVARFERLREAPLSTWTWTELRDWRGLRRQRLSEVLRRRGLPPEPPLLVALEQRLETDVLTLEVSRHSSSFPNADVDPRLAHVLAYGGRRTQGFSAAMHEEREEFVPRGLFALEAWCMVSVDDASPQAAREAWRSLWLELDVALGVEGLARLAVRPPRLSLDDDDDNETRSVIEVTVVVEASNAWQVAPQRLQHTFAQPEITIGRRADNDIVLAGGGLARHHATLQIESGTVFIADREATNGVILDGSPIRGVVVLAPGQVATLGAWQVSVRLPDPS